jgi:hypothetical protein
MRVQFRTSLLACAVLCGVSLPAQEPASAGGKWTRSDRQNPDSHRAEVVFTLPADEAELGRSPEIDLTCTGDGKFIGARYFTDTELLAKDGDYKNYEAPAIFPKVRIDKRSFRPIWDLLGDRKSTALDKKTLRAIFGGAQMQVRYTDKQYNNLVDVYTVSGLNKDEIVKACGQQGWF